MTELIYTWVMVQITIVCITLYLHRGQAHRAVSFHPASNNRALTFSPKFNIQCEAKGKNTASHTLYDQWQLQN